MQKYFLLLALCIFFRFAQAQTPDITLKYAGEELTSNTSVVDLGPVEANTVGPARIFTIENHGDSPLYLTGGARKVWQTSQRFDAFKIDETALPYEILPGSSGSFSVTFAPFFYDFGELSMTITIHNNDGDENPFVFYATGTATTSDIHVKHNGTYLVHDASVVDLGTVTTGQSSLVEIAIENQGDAPLTFEQNIFVGGANPQMFIVNSQGLPPEIMPGDSALFTIEFKPTSAGDKSAYIAIRADDPNMEFFVFDVTGKGVLPLVPEIEVIHDNDQKNLSNSGGMLMNPVVITKTGPMERLTIRNTGTADLIFTSPDLIVVSGQNASEFVVDKTGLPSAIAPGGSGYIYVTSNPIGTGFRYMTLTIPNNDADENPFSINVLGEGINPEFQIRQGADIPSGGFVSFYSVPVGMSTYPYDFWIRSSGIGDLEFYGTPMVTKVSGDVQDFIIDESTMARVLPSHNETKFSITFKPLTTGKKSMVVTIVNSDLDEGNFTFTVTGKTGNLRGNGRVQTEADEVEETDGDLSIERAFPNPTRETFSIWTGGKKDEQVLARALTISGTIVQNFTWPGASLQKIGDLWKPGLYIFEIRNSRGRKVIKLVKE
jgi:hypothetical protein